MADSKKIKIQSLLNDVERVRVKINQRVDQLLTNCSVNDSEDIVSYAFLINNWAAQLTKITSKIIATIDIH